MLNKKICFRCQQQFYRKRYRDWREGRSKIGFMDVGDIIKIFRRAWNADGLCVCPYGDNVKIEGTPTEKCVYIMEQTVSQDDAAAK
jgi:hypothetical protein